jgi:hypothetical protein
MRTFLLLLLFVPASASAAVTLGFIEKFPSGVGAWAGNGAAISNPGTGGVDGDGYLQVSSLALASRLATRSDGLEYHGDWINAGINQIKLYLNDIGTDQNLSIHVVVGNPSNFWLCNTGFAPPLNAWGQFTVDLTDSANFTHIISFDGLGFAAALRNADRLHIRHDVAPYAQGAHTLLGDYGIDNIELTSTLIGVEPLPTSAGLRPIELSAPYPNPMRGALACAFETSDASAVRIAIIDAAGRLVRSETLPGTAPGRRTWMWDGLDQSGRVAPAGAYRVRVTGKAGGTSRPFVKID